MSYFNANICVFVCVG